MNRREEEQQRRRARLAARGSGRAVRAGRMRKFVAEAGATPADVMRAYRGDDPRAGGHFPDGRPRVLEVLPTLPGCGCECGACGREDHDNCSHAYACGMSPRGIARIADARRRREARDQKKPRGLDVCHGQRVLTPMQRWDRTVQLWDDSAWSGGATWWIGRWVRPVRLFCAGDLCIGCWSNGGGERYPVTGRSSRGYDVRDYHVQVARHRGWPRSRSWDYHDAHPVPEWQWRALDARPSVQQRNKCNLSVIELPDGLGDLSPDDPDVRRFVAETLAAGDSAGPVGVR